jgi:hypothetical protein
MGSRFEGFTSQAACDLISSMNTTHLIALQTRLSHEKVRFATDGSEIRKVWIAQVEKEIAREMAHLGMESVLPEMTDDELLRELGL